MNAPAAIFRAAGPYYSCPRASVRAHRGMGILPMDSSYSTSFDGTPSKLQSLQRNVIASASLARLLYRRIAVDRR